MTTRRLTDEPLRIAPELVGLPLASPLRRLVAFGIDWVVLILPSVALSLGVAYLVLRVTEPRALGGMLALWQRRTLTAENYRAAVRDVLPLLARHEAPGLPPAALAAVEESDLDRAVTLVDGYAFQFSLNLGEFGQPPLPTKTVRVEVERLIPEGLRALALYGVLAVYFTLLTSSGGRTLGKRVARIRVVRLDGERLALVESLERFVGYLHIPGSLGLSLLYLWRDPNRRLPHDRVANTAVVRVVRTARTSTA